MPRPYVTIWVRGTPDNVQREVAKRLGWGVLTTGLMTCRGYTSRIAAHEVFISTLVEVLLEIVDVNPPRWVSDSEERSSEASS